MSYPYRLRSGIPALRSCEEIKSIAIEGTVSDLRTATRQGVDLPGKTSMRAGLVRSLTGAVRKSSTIPALTGGAMGRVDFFYGEGATEPRP